MTFPVRSDLVFAFGSNLDPASWQAYCRARGGDPDDLAFQGRAWLPDHRLRYHYRSARNRGGALDVVPWVGDAVAGALFRVRGEGWALLDHKEGHPARYAREPVWVVDDRGRPRRAWTYRVTEGRREGSFVAPTALYAARVRRGLRASGHGDAALAVADAAAQGRPRPLVEGVFVYGTLLRGERAADRIARHRPAAVVPARVRGRLLDLGAYPGLDAAADADGPGAHGELVRFTDVRAALATLDPYEDFRAHGDPANLYHRMVVVAETGDGARVPAWGYALARPPADAPVVAGGRWRSRRDP